MRSIQDTLFFRRIDGEPLITLESAFLLLDLRHNKFAVDMPGFDKIIDRIEV